jgi:hypothetical protein
VSTNLVTRYVADVVERGVKTSAQAALLALVSQNLGRADINAITVHWLPVVGFAGGGFVLSVLTSLASVKVGNQTSASMLSPVSTAVTGPQSQSVAPAAPVTEPALPEQLSVQDILDRANAVGGVVSPS